MKLPFSVLAKPTGAACNLNCAYCFFLSKDLLWDASHQSMSEDMLRSYLTAYFDAQPDGPVTLGWQGGEPTMRGLEFFRLAVRLANELHRPGQTVEHTIQTNGTLLDDEWGDFLAENHFLVGISIDGPADLHDHYRVNKAGRGSHAQVIRGWRLLQAHGVETNVLCTVNSVNVDQPLRVYRYFRDELGAQFIQFIPIVERVTPDEAAAAEAGWRRPDGSRVLYTQTGEQVTSRTVDPHKWGEFLSRVFDEWVSRDVGQVFVQHFDITLAAMFGQYSLCVHAPECGRALTIEHNGDVYSCDHFVESDYLLGNIAERGFAEMLASPMQLEFGRSKRTALTRQCQECPVRWACNGGCPKDRFSLSRDGEPGQNYLCQGYYNFFTHVTPAMQAMGRLLQQGHPASDIMAAERP